MTIKIGSTSALAEPIIYITYSWPIVEAIKVLKQHLNISIITSTLSVPLSSKAAIAAVAQPCTGGCQRYLEFTQCAKVAAKILYVFSN